jgi:hypothetical protein
MNDHQEQVQFFTIKSPQRRGQYKLFRAHYILGISRRIPSPSRGRIPKSNIHKEIVGEVLFLENQMTHSTFGSNHSLEAWILLELRREWWSSRNSVGKLFQINGVSNLVREGRIPFYRHSSKK